MKRTSLFTVIWISHGLCCTAALLSFVAILWPQVFLPDAWEERIIQYAGKTALYGFRVSLLLLGACTVGLLLRLRYRKALGQIVGWATLWAGVAGVFVLMAYVADVPLPKGYEEGTTATTTTEMPEPPNDILTGPEALFVLITPERFASMDVDTVARAPHLTQLETEHSKLLRQYLKESPRWALYMDDDTFYTKPGHMVMSPPGTSNGNNIQGLVHVAFRHLEEGEPIPTGYTVVKPGEAMPERPEGSEQVDDLALDLGRSHYLLLAWRGTSHVETARRALNAAIATVDSMVQPLAEEPTEATVERMLEGKRSMMADKPELLLSQPPAQYGAYQAEIYVNPGEAGTIILRVADMETDTPLRFFYCPALHSAKAGELFRHDIPGSATTQQEHTSIFGSMPGLLPERAPLFAIKQGEAHQFFNVAFEVWFQPSSPLKPRRMLMRRVYRVQACEAPDTPQTSQTPTEATPLAPAAAPAAPTPTTREEEIKSLLEKRPKLMPTEPKTTLREVKLERRRLHRAMSK